MTLLEIVTAVAIVGSIIAFVVVNLLCVVFNKRLQRIAEILASKWWNPPRQLVRFQRSSEGRQNTVCLHANIDTWISLGASHVRREREPRQSHLINKCDRSSIALTRMVMYFVPLLTAFLLLFGSSAANLMAGGPKNLTIPALITVSINAAIVASFSIWLTVLQIRRTAIRYRRFRYFHFSWLVIYPALLLISYCGYIYALLYGVGDTTKHL